MIAGFVPLLWYHMNQGNKVADLHLELMIFFQVDDRGLLSWHDLGDAAANAIYKITYTFWHFAYRLIFNLGLILFKKTNCKKAFDLELIYSHDYFIKYIVRQRNKKMHIIYYSYTIYRSRNVNFVRVSLLKT